ncbi:hypothetical protein BGZ63DRAFT_424632 [Mariannaea sp. PMI_226]|nr:hypothetical protein BGZ63DRAFT_424632 [Mariannaea sp. PMI_226]
MAQRLPFLPMEIILDIIQCLAPPNPDEILPPTDERAKTALSFTRVCQATYITATRLLRQHCMYIDSNAKACALARCLALPPPSFLNKDGAQPTLTRVEKLFLAPFTTLKTSEEELSELMVRLENDSFDNSQGSDTTSNTSDVLPSSLNDLPTVMAVRDILLAVAPTLRRLTIDMPLRSLYPEDDHQGVRPILRQGFEALSNLEEFSSIRDELFLRMDGEDDLPVWSLHWPKLRRLCLYNVYLEDILMHHLTRPQHLEVAIFPRADVDSPLTQFDIKQEWLSALGQSGHAVNSLHRQPSNRPTGITIVLANWAPLQPVFSARLRSRWAELDPDNLVRILLADAIQPRAQVDGDVNPIELTQEFIMQHALAGTLWEEGPMGLREAPFEQD